MEILGQMGQFPVTWKLSMNAQETYDRLKGTRRSRQRGAKNTDMLKPRIQRVPQ